MEYFNGKQLRSIDNGVLRKYRCYKCNKTFVIENDEDYYNDIVGKLECRIHPMEYDSINETYKCCGASKNAKKFKQFEFSRPYGCYKIDHCFSNQELQSIINYKYTVIPEILLPDKRKLDILKLSNDTDNSSGINRKELKQYVALFIDEQKVLNNDFKFKTEFGNTVLIDLKQEYDRMVENFFTGSNGMNTEDKVGNLSMDDKYYDLNDVMNSSDIINYQKKNYKYEDDYDTESSNDDEEEFNTNKSLVKLNKKMEREGLEYQNFYLIRRMDYKPDSTKVLEFM